MAYTPSLRHLSLLFTLPLGFFVGSVITHLKLQGAALATSPLREGGVEPEEEAVRRAAIEREFSLLLQTAQYLAARKKTLSLTTHTRFICFIGVRLCREEEELAVRDCWPSPLPAVPSRCLLWRRFLAQLVLCHCYRLSYWLVCA